MSVSMTYVRDKKNVKRVMDLYLSGQRPTLEDVAKELGTTYQNVRYIAASELDPERYKLEKAIRYSRSKTGSLNPMNQKSGSQHHNFKGDIPDGHGYLMRKVGGKYHQVHRLMMAEALGLGELPSTFVVHHINGDSLDNRLDNFALVTPVGHGVLHSEGSYLSKLTIWEHWELGTSRLRETTPT